MITVHAAKLLKRWRAEKGLEQKDIAEMLGISASMISQIEGGERNLQLSDVRRLKRVFEDRQIEYLERIVVCELNGIAIDLYAPLDGDRSILQIAKELRRDGDPKSACKLLETEVSQLDQLRKLYPSDEDRIHELLAQVLLELVDTQTHVATREEIWQMSFKHLETLEGIRHFLSDPFDEEYSRVLPTLIRRIASGGVWGRSELRDRVINRNKRLTSPLKLTTSRALALAVRAAASATATYVKNNKDVLSPVELKRQFSQFQYDVELAEKALTEIKNLQYRAQVCEVLARGFGVFGDYDFSSHYLHRGAGYLSWSLKNGGGGMIIAMQLSSANFLTHFFNPDSSHDRIEQSARLALEISARPGYIRYGQEIIDPLLVRNDLREIGLELQKSTGRGGYSPIEVAHLLRFQTS